VNIQYGDYDIYFDIT